MSMRSLEREILSEAKTLFKNPKLRLKDLMEWSDSEEVVRGNCQDDEIVAELPIGVWACIAKSNDRRMPAGEKHG